MLYIHSFIIIFIALYLSSCTSKPQTDQHLLDVKTDTISESQLGQSGMNINAYETYLSLKKDLDSTYKVTLNKYRTCEYCFDAADSLRTTQIHQALIKHHTSWQALQELEDDILGNIYYGGTMRGGVMNLNRRDLINAQLEFYKNFY